MAWTSPRTFIAGEIVTAAHFNTHIRDNFLELGPPKVAAAGDFLVGGAGGLTLRRIPIGVPVGAVLMRDAATGAYLWSNQSVPTGMIIYFDGTACPSGWLPFTAAQGRVIVGRLAGGTLGGTVGTALGNLGARMVTQVPVHAHSAGTLVSSSDGVHVHGITNSGYATFEPWDTAGSTGSPDPPNYAATQPDSGHPHSVGGATGFAGSASVDVTNPYIQFLVCQKE